MIVETVLDCVVTFDNIEAIKYDKKTMSDVFSVILSSRTT